MCQIKVKHEVRNSFWFSLCQKKKYYRHGSYKNGVVFMRMVFFHFKIIFLGIILLSLSTFLKIPKLVLHKICRTKRKKVFAIKSTKKDSYFIILRRNVPFKVCFPCRMNFSGFKLKLTYVISHETENCFPQETIKM